MGIDSTKLIEIPQIQTFICADGVIHDQYSGKKTIVGIFDNFITDVFPTKHHGCAIYIAISGGNGTIPVILKMMNLNTLDSAVIGEEEWRVMEPAAPIPPLIFWIAPEFSGPGVYCFELSVNAPGTKHHGYVIGTKRFEVKKQNMTITRPKL